MIKIKKFIILIIFTTVIILIPLNVCSLDANEGAYQCGESTIKKYKNVYVKKLNVRSGPGLKHEKIGSLNLNQQVQILFKVSNWYKIKFKDGYGWCKAEYLNPPIIKSLDQKDKNAQNKPINNKNLSSGHFIVIKTNTNKMAYYQDKVLIKQFDIATGKKSTPTPKGKFKIVNKIVNMPYYKYNIPGGDPRNPLGKRWLGLNVGDTCGTTYGIHGNNNESSIGKNVSGGCIRMYNTDINWLFEKVPKETIVIVSGEDKSFNEILKSYDINVN